MSKHREVLEKLIRSLTVQYPGCGITIFGSVLRGREHPDSDLDMFVVVEGDGTITLDQSSRLDGVLLDMATFPSDTLAKELAEEPFKFWFFACSQIVHDPNGLAKRHHDVARQYFDTHPTVDAVWRQFAKFRQESKPKLIADPNCGIVLPTWAQVAERARVAAEKAQ